ncbi:hypothetical protein SAMN05428950_11524, partial [Sphingomonas sp. OV641]
MGQVRHGCATTTHAVRAAIQRSQASLATLSRELGIKADRRTAWEFLEHLLKAVPYRIHTILTDNGI